MGIRTEKLHLYTRMLAATGEERYRLALEIMSDEIEFLLKQVPDLLPVPASVGSVADALRQVASIGYQALHDQ